MGADQSKPESTNPLSIAQIILTTEYKEDYGVELPIDLIEYMEGNVLNKTQFLKTYDRMTSKGYNFKGIERQDEYEISKWGKGDDVEKRGWKIKHKDD